MAIDFGGIFGNVSSFVSGVFSYGSSFVYIAISLVFVVVFFLIIRHVRIERGAFGSREEKNIEKEGGFWPLAAQIAKVVRAQRRQRQQAKALEKQEEIAEKREKAAERSAGTSNTPESNAKIEAEKALEIGTNAAEQAEVADVATTALEGRIQGMVAAISEVARKIEGYVKKDKKTEAQQSEEIAVVNRLFTAINNTANEALIDQRVNNYLLKLFDEIRQVLEADVNGDREKTSLIKDLVEKLREAIDSMKTSSDYAKRELNDIKRAGKKERNDIGKEISDIKAALKIRRERLKKLRRGKGKISMEVVAKLEREIMLKSRQLESLNQLKTEIKKMMKLLRKGEKAIKHLLKKVASSEKQTKKYVKIAAKREKDIEKREKKLQDASNRIAAEELKQKGNNPHEVAISISDYVNKFYRAFANVVRDDMRFDTALKDVIIKCNALALQIEAVENLKTGLTEVEKSLENGMMALTNIVATILSDRESQYNLNQLIEQIKKEGNVVAYQQQLDNFVREITRKIELKVQEATMQVTFLIKQDEALISYVENSANQISQNIGRVMGTMMKRKEAIEAKYMPNVAQYTAQMRRTNPYMQRAFNTAYGLEREAERRAA